MKFFAKDYNKKSDEELAVLIRNGSEKAFNVIYERYSAKLLNFICRLLNDKDKSQDLLHDVFLKLIEKPELFNPDKKFSTWLYTITINLCRNEHKRGAKFESLDDEFIALNIGIQDTLFDIAEFNRLLEMELLSMDISHRSVFIMRFREGLPVREIAEILGCPEGTVKSRIHYSLKNLSDKLYMFNPKSRN